MVEKNIPLLDSKISKFKSSFLSQNKNENNKDKIIYISDFDYTITSKYDYSTNEKLYNSYEIYNQNVFGEDHSLYLERDKKLYEEYAKYEDDSSFDYETRKEKTFEWYKYALLNMSHPKLTIDSIKKMVDMNLNKIKFRKKFKELFELLIKNNIPIIIISGGIKEIIKETLKILNIDGLEDYFKKKRIIIIANSLFDDNLKLINWQEKKDDIIYPFNKNIMTKKIIEKNFNGFENVFIVGDYVTDYYPISELKLNTQENIIGIGFLSYEPKKLKSIEEIKKDSIYKEYEKVYDVTLLNDEGYDFIINIFKQILIL